MGTWNYYAQTWKEWESLLDSVPGAGEDLELVLLYWIGLNFGSGMSHSGMSRRMSALAFWFKSRKVEDVTKSFLVRQAMRGFRRGQRVRDSRRPVSYEMLVSLGAGLMHICVTEYEIWLFRAAFSLAFFGAFRISELVSPSKSKEGGLAVGDIVRKGDLLECTVRRSKMDQLGKGALVSLWALEGSPMCPVYVVGEYMARRPSFEGPFLVHLDGSYLSVFQFTSVFRKAVVRIGRTAKDFSSHLFRIGAATEAARTPVFGVDSRAFLCVLGFGASGS